MDHGAPASTSLHRDVWQKRLALLPFLLVGLLAPLSCDDDSTAPQDTWYEARATFSLGVNATALSTLSLAGINGTIHVEGSSRSDSLFVAGERKVRAHTTQEAEDHLPYLQVGVDTAADTLLVRTIQPSSGPYPEYRVDYNITLPHSMEVMLVEANGAITVQGVENSVTARHGNGSVTLDEVVGSVQVQLGNGDVTCQASLPLDGSINLAVGNGGIELRIPASTSAVLVAQVGVGRITTSNLVLHDATFTPHYLAGRLGPGRGEIALGLGNGGIAVIGY